MWYMSLQTISIMQTWGISRAGILADIGEGASGVRREFGGCSNVQWWARRG
ncbi:hypothetical protein LCGC14_1812180, partial [marine sediment metagenome]